MPFSRLTNNQFASLFDYASIGIIIANDKGEIQMANSFLQRLFGYDDQEMQGMKIEQLIPQRYRERHVGHRERYESDPHNRPMGLGMELSGVHKNGTEFPVEVSLGHYKIGEEGYAMAFVNDITQRKDTEDAIKQLNEHLEQKVKEGTKSLAYMVDRLGEQMKETERKDHELQQALEKERELNELKSRFVSMASHEFRTPLSGILSSAYLLSQYTTTDQQPQRDKHIHRIISSITSLTEILNDFLSIGKIDEGTVNVHYSDYDIKEQMVDVTHEIHHMLKKGQNISYKHHGDVIISLDPSMVRHIVTNLLTNAIKFSPENSPIEISTEHNEDFFRLSVKDKGIGIPKEDQKELFKRFFRSHNATNIQGTGLGLHIVQRYVELMGGTIECKSEAGKGTEFIITFNNQINSNENNIGH
jgi:PAS domain S-box-containing protein